LPFEIFKGFPSDFDGPVIDLLWPSTDEAGSAVEVPMRVYSKDGQRRVLIYAAEGSLSFDYPLEDVARGLERAAAALGQ